jgi:hypothetical protein
MLTDGMYCVHKGRVCVQAWNGREWVYIPEAEWMRLVQAGKAGKLAMK